MELIGAGSFQKITVSTRQGPVGVKARRLSLPGVFLAVVHEIYLDKLDPSWIGSLVVSRWEEAAGAVRQKTYYLVKHGVFTDLRRLEHIRQKHGVASLGGELDKLHAVADGTDKLATQLVGATGKRFRLTAHPIQAAELAVLLGRSPLRPSKIRAREMLLAAQLGEDKLGRFNPEATRARLRQVSRCTDRRIDEVIAVEVYCAARRQADLLLLAEAERRLYYAITRLLPWTNEQKMRQLDKIGQRRLADQLMRVAERLREVDYNPFRLSFLTVARWLDLTVTYMTPCFSADGTVDYIWFCIDELACQVIRIEVERIIWRLTCAQQRGWVNPPLVDVWRRHQAVYRALDRIARHDAVVGLGIKPVLPKLRQALVLLQKGKNEDLDQAREVFKEVSALL